MSPYIITLTLAMLIAWAGRISRNGLIRKISIFAVISVLTLFAGLRNWTVGTDTGNYVEMLAGTTSVSDIWQSTEIGYNALMLVCASISENYAILLLVISFVVVSSYVKVIESTTKRYEVALFLFITLGAYTFFFNGARQGIATALCFLALPYLLERRLGPYFLLVGVAALFHHTALVVAPLYFLALPRSGWRQIFVVIIGAVALIAFLETFVQVTSLLLNDRYSTYAEAGEGGGRLTVAFLVSQGLALFFLRTKVQDANGYYQRLLNIYLIGLVPAIAATISNVNPSGLLRLSTYFSHTAVLLWPMVFIGIRSNLRHGLFGAIFFLTALAFFFLTTTSFSNLTPYRLNSEIFK